jgi:mevalonate kinase
MAAACLKTSAPGKLMILGEHGVLAGARCLVAAVDKRISVELQPRTDRQLHVQTEFGFYQSILRDLEPDNRFRFVIATVRALADELPSGLELHIRSEFSHKVGLGSSAAVTVAVAAALQNWCQKETTLKKIFAASLQVIHTVQGTGSGADVAASVYGGLVLYRMDPLLLTSIPAAPPLTVIYSGYKTPTVQVIEKVKTMQRQHPELIQRLYNTMDAISLESETAIIHQNWQSLGTLLNLNQGLLNAIGVSNADLEELINLLRQDNAIYGAKISGSGLGDCVIALGTASEQTLGRINSPRQILPVAISQTGVQVE